MPEQTLILHAGLRKTGTTAIQNYLCENLDHPEFDYFNAGIPNASLIINRAFAKGYKGHLENQSGLFSKFQALLERRGARKRFVSTLARYRKPTVILSAESVSSLSRDECADLLEVLSKQFDRVKLVIYLRPVYARMQSGFQEKLKYQLCRIDEGIRINLRLAVNKYDQVFGRDNVTLRQFAPGRFVNGNVVNDFLDWLAIEHAPVPSGRANSGLSLPAIQLLYVYRKRFPVRIWEDKLLIEKLGDLAGPRFRMHPDLLHQVVDESNAQYAWFEERAGFSLRDNPQPGEGAIRSEAELLQLGADTVQWLEQQLHGDAAKASVPSDHSRVASMMRELALALERSASTKTACDE